MSTTAAATTRWRSRAHCRRQALDVQVVSLSRNFGKEAALLAGLDHARRGAVLFMDGDGQHPPDLIETLVGHWLDDGYDVVYTAKAHRENESGLRRLACKTFYALINWGARQKIPEDAGDFRLLSPRAAAALRQLAGAQPLLQGAGELDRLPPDARRLRAGERAHGRTTLSLGSLIGLSIEGLTSFSVAPLRLASLLGVLLAIGAFIFGCASCSRPWSTASGARLSVGVVGLMVLGGVQLRHDRRSSANTSARSCPS